MSHVDRLHGNFEHGCLHPRIADGLLFTAAFIWVRFVLSKCGSLGPGTNSRPPLPGYCRGVSVETVGHGACLLRLEGTWSRRAAHAPLGDDRACLADRGVESALVARATG